jgi:hypothetical protein
VLVALPAMSTATRKEAAAILRRLLEAIRWPAEVAGYLRGYADGLDAHARRRKR